MLPEHDTYGLNKRFNFICQCIENTKPKNVLDYGCGVGTYLTFPLAKYFSTIEFTGTDTDAHSINHASNKSSGLDNLNFLTINNLTKSTKYEMIIASEVLEHVEDPVEFLNGLCMMLSHDGYIILTVPNGYGPFEWASFFESILYLSGIIRLINYFKNKVRKENASITQDIDTLANSPHINFFSYKTINELFDKIGIDVIKYKPRTFLCGFGFDKFIKSKKLLKWNENVSESMSPYLVSDWMFLLNNVGPGFPYTVKKNVYSKLRTKLNMKRAHL